MWLGLSGGHTLLLLIWVSALPGCTCTYCANPGQPGKVGIVSYTFRMKKQGSQVTNLRSHNMGQGLKLCVLKPVLSAIPLGSSLDKLMCFLLGKSSRNLSHLEGSKNSLMT